MQLTDEQEAAVDVLAASTERFALLAGLAGTGKTTTMRALVARLRADGRSVCIAAPTGKAAMVLRQKTGAAASTLHSLLYARVFDGADGQPVFSGDREAIPRNGVVIVDEASMVGRRLHRDLDERMPKTARCVYVGDHGQLPPVKEAWGPNFGAPTATLETIHRQSAGSSIIQAAHRTRTSGEPPYRNGKDGRYRYVHTTLDVIVRAAAQKIQPAVAEGVAPPFVVLVARKKTRARFNVAIRNALGFTGWPKVGEPLRVCANNYFSGLVNGEIVTVVHEGTMGVEVRRGIRIRTASGEEHTVSTPILGMDRRDWEKRLEGLHTKSRNHRDEWHMLDFAYASTCHSAQGSEWHTVAVYADDAQEYMFRDNLEHLRRWYYTAITRAAERCTLFTLTERP